MTTTSPVPATPPATEDDYLAIAYKAPEALPSFDVLQGWYVAKMAEKAAADAKAKEKAKHAHA